MTNLPVLLWALLYILGFTQVKMLFDIRERLRAVEVSYKEYDRRITSLEGKIS